MEIETRVGVKLSKDQCEYRAYEGPLRPGKKIDQYPNWEFHWYRARTARTQAPRGRRTMPLKRSRCSSSEAERSARSRVEAGLERSRTTMADGRCMHHSRGVEPEAMHAAWHA